MAYNFSSKLSFSSIPFVLLLSIFSSIPLSYSTPFILLHGIGMQCNDQGSMFYLNTLSMLSGIQGSCVEIGNGAPDSFNMPIAQQVEIACEKIKAMPELRQGYNLVGLSQGNIIGRGVIELCENAPPVKNFISIGGPNAGVSASPTCSLGPFCDAINSMGGMGVYTPNVQAHFAPSGYTKLPNAIPEYLKGCSFLPKINNEIPGPNNTIHKQRFISLQNLVLIMFENDGVVIPTLSSWFGYHPDGDSKTVLPPQQTNLYKEDLFGLKSLDLAGKIKFIKVPGMHLVITIPQIQQYVVPFLIDSAP